MELTNVRVVRGIAHEVIKATELEHRAPRYSTDTFSLDEKGSALIGDRLIDALSVNSHSLEVTVEDATQGSSFNILTAMLNMETQEFVKASQNLAKKLSAAQTAGSIKEGSAVIIQGECHNAGVPLRFISIIKADSDQGFYQHFENGNILLEYVSNMILGDSQRLIKIGFFLEDNRDPDQSLTRTPDDFTLKVYDHNLKQASTGTAALYFYSTFLGCKLADTSSVLTKRFFNVTASFLEKADIGQEQRVDLKNALITRLRSNITTLEPVEFARNYLPEQIQSQFVNECEQADIREAFSIDLALIRAKMRRQSIKFSSNVTIYAPPDIFKESIKVHSEATTEGWTDISIKGKIERMP